MTSHSIHNLNGLTWTTAQLISIKYPEKIVIYKRIAAQSFNPTNPIDFIAYIWILCVDGMASSPINITQYRDGEALTVKNTCFDKFPFSDWHMVRWTTSNIDIWTACWNNQILYNSLGSLLSAQQNSAKHSRKCTHPPLMVIVDCNTWRPDPTNRTLRNIYKRIKYIL